MNISERVIKYYSNLKIETNLPEGISVLNPYGSDEVMNVCWQFYNKYYNDNDGRIFIVGINPGEAWCWNNRDTFY